MTRLALAALAALLIVAAPAEPQAPPVTLDQALLRVRSQGNELFAMRESPVAYSTLEQIATSIAGGDRLSLLRHQRRYAGAR